MFYSSLKRKRFSGTAATLGTTLALLTPKVQRVLKSVLKARTAKAAPRIAKTSTQTQTASRYRSTKKPYVTGASYRGRLTRRRFPRKRSGVAAKGENYFARHGVTDTVEVSGTVSDADCVYIGHSSFSPHRLLEAAVAAVLRKMYRQAIGYDVSSVEETIPYKNGNSDGHTIHVWWRGSDGNIAHEYHAIPVSQSLQTLSYSAIGNIFKRADESDYHLLRMSILDNETNLCRATLDLTKVTFDFMYKSELKIQNVTISNAASDEADDVNNVPLVGRNYEFKNWYPGTNGALPSNLLDAVNQETGVTLTRASNLPGFGWREPPPSKVFDGCVKSEKIRIQPGTIKSDWLIGHGSMTLDKFLKGLRFDYITGTPAQQGAVRNRRVNIGRHSMVALEKVISINGTLPIKVFYEVNHFMGISCRAGFTHPALGSYWYKEANLV